MSRLAWFALGAFTGALYTTRVRRDAETELGIGQFRASRFELDRVRLGTRLAAWLDNTTERLSDRIDENGHALASRVREGSRSTRSTEFIAEEDFELEESR